MRRKNPIRLTPREYQIIRHTAFGLSAREQGYLMNISHRTIQKHLQNIYKKFQIHSRVALVRMAHEGKFEAT